MSTKALLLPIMASIALHLPVLLSAEPNSTRKLADPLPTLDQLFWVHEAWSLIGLPPAGWDDVELAISANIPPQDLWSNGVGFLALQSGVIVFGKGQLGDGLDGLLDKLSFDEQMKVIPNLIEVDVDVYFFNPSFGLDYSGLSGEDGKEEYLVLQSRRGFWLTRDLPTKHAFEIVDQIKSSAGVKAENRIARHAARAEQTTDSRVQRLPRTIENHGYRSHAEGMFLTVSKSSSEKGCPDAEPLLRISLAATEFGGTSELALAELRGYERVSLFMFVDGEPVHVATQCGDPPKISVSTSPICEVIRHCISRGSVDHPQEAEIETSDQWMALVRSFEQILGADSIPQKLEIVGGDQARAVKVEYELNGSTQVIFCPF